MGLRCGIDIVEMERIEKALAIRDGAFLRRVYTEAEIAYCQARGAGAVASFAARFSAKEAVSKALGTGIGRDASFQEIEILSEPSGRPIVKLTGSALARFRDMGGRAVEISLTHAKAYAAAYVVIETKDETGMERQDA